MDRRWASGGNRMGAIRFGNGINRVLLKISIKARFLFLLWSMALFVSVQIVVVGTSFINVSHGM